MWALVLGISLWAIVQLLQLTGHGLPADLVRGGYILACILIILGGFLYVARRD